MLNLTVQKYLLVLLSFSLFQGCSETEVPKRASTVSSNVEVIAQTFTIPVLNRKRNLRIYLPPDYHTSDKHYSVIYMHDGQNLFDDVTSYVGEWNVDETLNKLFVEKGLSIIVIGIDNGQDKRMNELSPWPNSKYGAAEGEHYMEFIVKLVKPFVDKNYRTLSDQKNTAIMGSSMGGLISHYGIFNYPDTFSKAGIYSPSYWFSDEVFKFSDAKKLHKNSKLFILVGRKEGPGMVKNVNKMSNQLITNGLNLEQIKTKVVKGGEHNEKLWSSEFSETIQWLFSEQLKKIIKK
ncbi:MAG: esterase [Gammaproteobacteria bacterium]|nr:MAG: esterase [Gammaproteobacteria bacterium]